MRDLETWLDLGANRTILLHSNVAAFRASAIDENEVVAGANGGDVETALAALLVKLNKGAGHG